MRIVVRKTDLQSAGPSNTNEFAMRNALHVQARMQQNCKITVGHMGWADCRSTQHGLQIVFYRKNCDAQEYNQIVCYMFQGNIRWAIGKVFRYERPRAP